MQVKSIKGFPGEKVSMHDPLIGHIFNGVKVLRDTGFRKNTGARIVLALCHCGKEFEVALYMLKVGRTKSCGCWHHGESSRSYRTPEWKAWKTMKHRCYYSKDKCFNNYGGRGISVCERWLDSYKNFLADMGRKPSLKHSLDRINNDGNYEPGNCRWATPSQQARNKRWNGRKPTGPTPEERER